jgi:hypothetical protein
MFWFHIIKQLMCHVGGLTQVLVILISNDMIIKFSNLGIHFESLDTWMVHWAKFKDLRHILLKTEKFSLIVGMVTLPFALRPYKEHS